MFRPGSASAELAEDHLRKLVEACELPTGFLLLVDIDWGFSGVGIRLGEHLIDEFPKGCLITAPLTENSCHPTFVKRAIHPRSDQNQRLLSLSSCNASLFCSRLESHTNWSSHSIWLPMAPPPFSTESTSLYSVFNSYPSSANICHSQYSQSLNCHSACLLAAALEVAASPLRMPTGRQFYSTSQESELLAAVDAAYGRRVSRTDFIRKLETFFTVL
ncbi:unnamed protein product [Protopolystoma xenopodis]|uniref:Uncharacterized protein n=1 Tax=Protopolystoma xenopodis TaxID=117903 RepID=A0A448WPQ6_9PLAT|nr:unnamed protein product [Protopolystoma xenopodis]